MSDDSVMYLAMLVIATCGREEWMRLFAGALMIAHISATRGTAGEWVSALICLLALAYAVGMVAADAIGFVMTAL